MLTEHVLVCQALPHMAYFLTLVTVKNEVDMEPPNFPKEDIEVTTPMSSSEAEFHPGLLTLNPGNRIPPLIS